MASTDAPVRSCDVCGEEDTGPRHIFSSKNQPPIIRHLACCAAQGCPTCNEEN